MKIDIRILASLLVVVLCVGCGAKSDYSGTNDLAKSESKPGSEGASAASVGGPPQRHDAVRAGQQTPRPSGK